VKAYETLGYETCANGDFEAGCEKIAIFVGNNGEPTHAARQLGPNKWTSKLGGSWDIDHQLNAVAGGLYGTVAQYMHRPKP
jgi:hypothetical protein